MEEERQLKELKDKEDNILFEKQLEEKFAVEKVQIDESKVINRSAESVIMIIDDFMSTDSFNPMLLKYRLPKRYRIKDIDDQLSQKRLKAEVVNMYKARRLGINVPAIYSVNK